MLDQRRADHRRGDATKLLQRQRQPDHGRRAGDQTQIGWKEGRSVEDAKTGLPERAVQEVCDHVPREVVPNELFVTRFALGEAIGVARWDRRGRHAPILCKVGLHLQTCWLVTTRRTPPAALA